jgi:GTP pyrophosphokinase
MFQDQVFCFSPRGDLIALPKGATPVDFAYAVHTDVGDTCVGAKINGKIKPLKTILENGDQVEIVRSNVAAPSPTWENFVATGKARSRIRRFVRLRELDEYVRLGEAILERAFAQASYEMSKKAIKRACAVLARRRPDDLYASVGRGELTGQQVVGAVYPEAVGGERAALKHKPKNGSAGDHAVPIRGLIPGMAVHFATCCHPLPGDRIVGIVTTGKGVTIHTIDCDMLQQFEATPERWLDVAWTVSGDSPETHVGRVHVVVVNEPGTLGTMTTLIGRNNGNISNLKITNRSADFFDMVLDLEVRDIRHLSNIIAALRASPCVSSVERARA